MVLEADAAHSIDRKTHEHLHHERVGSFSLFFIFSYFDNTARKNEESLKNKGSCRNIRGRASERIVSHKISQTKLKN